MKKVASDAEGEGAECLEGDAYRSAVESSPDPIMIYDFSGRILWMNQRTVEVFGARSREELLEAGTTVFDFLSPDGVERARANFSKTLTQGQSRTSEYEVTIGGGRKLTVEINSSLVHDPAGKAQAFVSVIRDVTERKRFEQHLITQKQLAERLASVESREEALRICLDAVIAQSEADSGTATLLGPDGSQTQITSVGLREPGLTGPILFAPDSLQAKLLAAGRIFYGHHRDAPENVREAVVAEGLEAVALIPVLVGGKPVAGFAVMSHRHPEFSEASKRWIESVGAQVAGVLERLASIEEKRRVEDRLQQAMKMEAVGRLAGGVAHDFNNLLTAIIGNLSLAMLDLSAQDPIVHRIAEANRAAESAAELVKQLLAFSRRQLIEPRVFDLNELLTRLSRLIERLIGEDIKLVVSPAAEPCLVLADPGQLEQVLANLSVNARDAMPDGGALVLETALVELDDAYCASHVDARPGAYVRLAVSDTGLGIADDVKPHVFEPFYTTKTTGHGTGLGLATTYAVVKQAGGSIEVYSEVGRGTSFKLYLPRIRGVPPTSLDRRDLGDMPRGSETVLLVEDEPFVRGLATRVMRRLGYEVLVARDGREALELAGQTDRAIDLLVTDVVMPGMNGRELAGRLCEARPGLKVLYTSGYTENAIAHHGVIDEGVQFLAKPYAPAVLAQKLRQVLAGVRGSCEGSR